MSAECASKGVSETGRLLPTPRSPGLKREPLPLRGVNPAVEELRGLADELLQQVHVTAESHGRRPGWRSPRKPEALITLFEVTAMGAASVSVVVAALPALSCSWIEVTDLGEGE
jgi:hypothetical protein